MGLLIRQENEDWVIEIREEWYPETKPDMQPIIDLLMEKEVPFKIDYAYEMYIVKIKDAKVVFKEREEMGKYLKRLIDIKSEYGHKERNEND